MSVMRRVPDDFRERPKKYDSKVNVLSCWARYGIR